MRNARQARATTQNDAGMPYTGTDSYDGSSSEGIGDPLTDWTSCVTVLSSGSPPLPRLAYRLAFPPLESAATPAEPMR